ncbi:MarR family winged helix-turn-helix transcriptional regulator [Robertmurraya sp. FSL R5-0851]|uniref:MarR family winged helix-turn-helix transcriptional regulator n=1 Tax=Robertmurraya sp. FSL R5-0851 TaxID=2921584 RepID=UPI0030F7C3C1
MSIYNIIMIKYDAASKIGKIRDAANKLILSEIEKHGVEGIAPSHGDILMCLYKKNGLSVKELAEKIHRTQPTVTVLIDKLVKLGYVEKRKNQEDSRVTIITLTEMGKQLEPIFKDVSRKLNQVIYGSLSVSEKEQLEQLLDRILKSF